MVRTGWWLFGLLFLFPWMGVRAQSGISITQPLPGEALQGTVNLQGSTSTTDFKSAEVAFAYESDPNTWFIIQRSDQPVESGILATWDTTTITDGVYRLRARVFLMSGKELITEVQGVRVRNYTPIETNTPSIIPLVTGTAQPTATVQLPTPTVPFITLTPLPTNPAEISSAQLVNSLEKGGLGALGLFVALGFYLILRAASRRMRS